MAKNVKQTTFWAKIETTYGTDPTPSGSSNAVRVYEGEVDPEIDENLREELGITNSPLVGIGGKQRQMVSMKVPLKGSGTAGTAPKGLGDLLRACGLQETVVGATSVTYKPRDASMESVTIYVNQDGVQHIVKGAVGDLKGELVAGELPFVSFDMKGLWADPADVTFPTTHTPDTTKEKALKNLTCTIDSYAIVLRSFKFALSNEIAERPDFNAATGIAGFQVVDRKPDVEFEIELVSLATKNYFSRLTADTICPFSVVLNNGAGNIITLTGNMRIKALKYGDGDKIRLQTIQGQLCSDSSHTPGSELSIALT